MLLAVKELESIGLFCLSERGGISLSKRCSSARLSMDSGWREARSGKLRRLRLLDLVKHLGATFNL